MTLKQALIILPALVLLAAGCSNGNTSSYNNNSGNENYPDTTNSSTSSSSLTNTPRTLTLNMKAQNNSKQDGSATLTENGTSTLVTVTINNEPQGASEPDHIHTGACPSPGGVKYPLANVENGISQTLVPASYDQLMAQLPLAINVHKSAKDINTYYSCGDIVNNP